MVFSDEDDEVGGTSQVWDDIAARNIAESSLRIGSIKLNLQRPFQWASGYFMPIYNDNRMNLGDLEARSQIVRTFLRILESKEIGQFDIVAGTSTAGIP